MRIMVAVPLLIVAILGGIFFMALQEPRDETLPSVLLDKPAPDFALPFLNPDGVGAALPDTRDGDRSGDRSGDVDGDGDGATGEGSEAPAGDSGAGEGLGTPAALFATGQPVLVNFWASWCAPCRVEHPLLMRLAQEEGIRIIGLNYKDRPPAARQFLKGLGDPFEVVVRDETGRTAIEWGVSGVPETFVIDADGVIRARHVGPLTQKAWADLAPYFEATANTDS